MNSCCDALIASQYIQGAATAYYVYLIRVAVSRAETGAEFKTCIIVYITVSYCIYIYKYIYIYICVCMYTYIYIYICIFACVRMCIYVNIFHYVHMFVYLKEQYQG